MEFLLYLLLGGFAGVLAGLFGVGGGLIIVPVLVLSALSSVDERIRGLRAGGDDYLAKPFRADELIARVRVALERSTCRTAPIRLGAIAEARFPRPISAMSTTRSLARGTRTAAIVTSGAPITTPSA